MAGRNYTRSGSDSTLLNVSKLNPFTYKNRTHIVYVSSNLVFLWRELPSSASTSWEMMSSAIWRQSDQAGRRSDHHEGIFLFEGGSAHTSYIFSLLFRRYDRDERVRSVSAMFYNTAVIAITVVAEQDFFGEIYDDVEVALNEWDGKRWQ